MTAVSQAANAASGQGSGPQLSASVVNSFRVAAVAGRLATHTQSGRQPQSTEFFSLCLSLARGIDYAIANNEVPAKAQELPILLKQICQHRNDLFLQAAIMVLMISVKNACKMSWFSDRETQELLSLANEVGSCFCTPGDIINGLDCSLSTVLEIMSRFYPLMKMGQILASLEAQPGYGAFVVDFHISKNISHSPHEKIRLFVAQKDNIETSACIISPQQVNFLLNGKGVERRTNVLMDMGPQLPTNVTAMLKYGTNLLQAVGQFCGHYVILIAFMSMESSPDASTLPDYVPSGDVAPGSDSDLIEGPSRISLKCPISRTRIRTPVKGHACKHLQCFDFKNYVDINSRRPSWRCPHCNQHVCYTNIHIDQNIAKVLKEVAEDVSDVIISADGSWKAVMQNDDDDVDELQDKILNCEKDGSEQQESATGVPIVLDLTQSDTEVDAMETIEIEDTKPPVANLQSLSAAPNLTTTPELVNAAGTNQNIVSNMEDNFWSALYSSLVPGTSTRIDTQVGGRSESTPNITVASVFSDAISPVPNQADACSNANPTTPVVQNQIAAANLPLQPSQLMNTMPNHEHGNLHNMIPRHVSRTPIAVQALPAIPQTQTPTPHRLRNSINTMNTNSSLRTPHQSKNQQERTFVPGQSVQQVGVAAPSQLQGSYRALGEFQNPHLQQSLNTRMSQPRSPSPGLIRSPSPLLRAQAQQGAAQVGIHYAAGNVSSIPTRFRATQMAGQPRPAAPYPGNVDGSRIAAVDQRLNMGGSASAATSRADTSADLGSDQNWQPTGRMRGSLAGRAYSEALTHMMIQPTQSTQAATRPQTNITSPPSVPPHLQAILANSRNPVAPQMQNNAMTQTDAVNSSSGTFPNMSSGM
ncbi:E4 SUMO-protein ligase PIAL2 isoform X2 [Hibiscus syriacus]|uniref:E4 SUMO-protein ligase PIAL2 isoform X2 n=1 Tax=Hibiscus syriacus TaxID=106335 RepID=UPI001924C577|nr:E4 SUMO-protein ligase PIAL2 isoform X2 [Hibiscus syriacus]